MTTMFGGGACANDEEAKEPTISNKERATLFTMCLLAVRTSTSSLSNTSGTCFRGARLLEPKTIAPQRSHFALPTDSITSPSHGRRLRVGRCGKRIDIAEGRACSVDRFDFSSPGAGFISADANEVANALSTEKITHEGHVSHRRRRWLRTLRQAPSANLDRIYGINWI